MISAGNKTQGHYFHDFDAKNKNLHVSLGYQMVTIIRAAIFCHLIDFISILSYKQLTNLKVFEKQYVSSSLKKDTG